MAASDQQQDYTLLTVFFLSDLELKIASISLVLVTASSNFNNTIGKLKN